MVRNTEAAFETLANYEPYTTSASWNSDVDPSEPDDRLDAAVGATVEDAVALEDLAAAVGVDVETNYLAYVADDRSEFPAGAEHKANAQARFVRGDDPVVEYLESDGWNGIKGYDRNGKTDLMAFARANLIAGRAPFVDPRNVDADVTRVYDADLPSNDDTDEPPVATDGGTDYADAKDDEVEVVRRALRAATDDDLDALFGEVVDYAREAEATPARVDVVVVPAMVARKGLRDGFGSWHFDRADGPIPGDGGERVVFHAHRDDDVRSIRNRVLQALTTTEPPRRW